MLTDLLLSRPSRIKGLHDVTQEREVNDVQAQQSEISQTTDSLWSFFDEKVAEASSETDSFIEVTRYFEEKNIDRKENPLQLSILLIL